MPIHRIRDSPHWDIHRLLRTPTAFSSETGTIPLGTFDPFNGNETFDFIQKECTILIIGAGGLGCELLKNVVLSGFTKIHIIDMDTIDISNLNRQFLFRASDIGQSKAICAARFVQERVQINDGIEIIPHFKRVQEMDIDFYRQFHVILSGLDNIEARRYVNSMIVSLAEMMEDEDGSLVVDPSTIIPFIDGGTEGLRGQARVIIPRITSCFECSLESFPPQTTFPMCTIAETPRQPAHCVSYAMLLEWPRAFPDKVLNKDSPQDMQWIYQQAHARAEQFGITGVTYTFTLGVVKNIIPAVASTNAIIAAMTVNEAFKAMTYCSQLMNNYHMHMGTIGTYSHLFEYEKKKDCLVCSSQIHSIIVDGKKMTLQELMDNILCNETHFRLSKPSISSPQKNLFIQGPPALKEATCCNLSKPLIELIQDGECLTITDTMFVGDVALLLQVHFKKENKQGV